MNENALQMHKLNLDVLNKKQEEEDANTHARASNGIYMKTLAEEQAKNNPKAIEKANQARATFNEVAGRDAQGKRLSRFPGQAKSASGVLGPATKKMQAEADVGSAQAIDSNGNRVGPIDPSKLAGVLEGSNYKNNPEGMKALSDHISSLPGADKIKQDLAMAAFAMKNNIGEHAGLSLYGQGAEDRNRKADNLMKLVEEFYRRGGCCMLDDIMSALDALMLSSLERRPGPIQLHHRRLRSIVARRAASAPAPSTSAGCNRRWLFAC